MSGAGQDFGSGAVSAAVVARIDAERTIDLDVYAESGCESRFDWLDHFAQDHGLPIEQVIAVADLLGAEEDFDGLVTAVEDATQGCGFCAGYAVND